NVTIHTTGELLSKSLDEFFKLSCRGYEFNSWCAFRPKRETDTLPYKYDFTYNDKPIQKIDTFEKLGIKIVSKPPVHELETQVMAEPIIAKSSTGQIYVKTSNRNITLQVSGSDTIYALKEMIQNKEFCLPVQQRLTYAGKLLNDECLIADYCIKKGSILNLSVIPKSLISITMPTGKPLNLEVCYDVTVNALKKIIQDKEGIPDNKFYLTFYLKSQQVYLDDENEESLLNYKIDLNFYSPLIPIYVNIFKRKSITLNVFKNDTVSDLKKMIQDKEGINSDHQFLIFREKELSNIRRLERYGVMKHSIIHLVLKDKALRKNSESKFLAGQIYVEMQTQEKIILDVSENSTINVIRKMINDKVSIDSHKYILVFAGTVLEDDYTLDDYNIKPES
ncbi:7569_t:CDS:2, partial [Racocetra fulgida]